MMMMLCAILKVSDSDDDVVCIVKVVMSPK